MFSEVLHRILSEVKTRDNKGWHEAVQASKGDFVQPKVASVPHEARRASRSTETKRTASPRSLRARRSSRFFFFETRIVEGSPCNEQRVTKCPQTNRQRGASRKATQSTGPNILVKKEVRNEHDGKHKQSLALEQGRIRTGMQNALPKAVGGNFARRMPLDATRRAALGSQISCCDNVPVQPAQLGGQRRWQHAVNCLCRTDAAVLTEYHRTGGAITLKIIVGCANAVNSFVMHLPIPWNRSFPTRSTCNSPW